MFYLIESVFSLVIGIYIFVSSLVNDLVVDVPVIGFILIVLSIIGICINIKK